MLAAVPDHGQNLTSALVLKRCEFTGSRAAAFVSDLIKDLLESPYLPPSKNRSDGVKEPARMGRDPEAPKNQEL
eukprot:scaffold5493_cov129-Skeletonema_marinoi.AAC.3